MNKQDVLRMPAGRDMDFLIHEKVMGRRPWNKELGTPEPASYSTDITEAWVVQEHMYIDGYDTFGLYRTKGGLWRSTFLEDHHIADANTAALAICRAALLAILEYEK